jgi:hypothetical protein
MPTNQELAGQLAEANAEIDRLRTLLRHSAETNERGGHAALYLYRDNHTHAVRDFLAREAEERTP